MAESVSIKDLQAENEWLRDAYYNGIIVSIGETDAKYDRKCAEVRELESSLSSYKDKCLELSLELNSIRRNAGVSE